MCLVCEKEPAVARIRIDYIPMRRGDIIGECDLCRACLRKCLRSMRMEKDHYPPEFDADVPDIFDGLDK